MDKKCFPLAGINKNNKKNSTRQKNCFNQQEWTKTEKEAFYWIIKKAFHQQEYIKKERQWLPLAGKDGKNA